MTGRHEAPPVSSSAREATAPPYHGRHRESDDNWHDRCPRCPDCGKHRHGGTCVSQRSQPDPDPPRCGSCGHPYDAECGCSCCVLPDGIGWGHE